MPFTTPSPLAVTAHSRRIIPGLWAAVLVLLCLVTPARAGVRLYATGAGGVGGLSGLYTIDTGTGVATLEWYLPGVHLYGGGLAYDASTDTLYATGVLDSDTGTSRLFTINRFTGAVTYFPGMSSTINISQGGLAINPVTGILYAVGGSGSQSTALFTIDKNTGAETLVGLAGGQCCTAPYGFNMYGLGFRSDGTLFANGLTFTNIPANESHLYTLSLADGSATDLGSHGVTIGRQLYYSGLAEGAGGTMYSMGSLSASAGGLYSVDPSTAVATAIGDMIEHLGVDGGLTFAPDGLPTAYCTAKVTSNGCTPAISSQGIPSASATSGFVVKSINVRNKKSGLLFYKVNGSQASTPYQGGTLCVGPSSIKRTPPTNSGGALPPVSDCSGVFTVDMNSFAHGLLGGVPAPELLIFGTTVQAQWWGRDPGFAAPNNTMLSDALAWAIAL